REPGGIELELRIPGPPARVPAPRREPERHRVPQPIELARVVVVDDQSAPERGPAERDAVREQESQRTESGAFHGPPDDTRRHAGRGLSRRVDSASKRVLSNGIPAASPEPAAPHREGDSMSVLVRIPTPLRTVTKGAAEVQAAGATVGDVIDDLDRQF